MTNIIASKFAGNEATTNVLTKIMNKNQSSKNDLWNLYLDTLSVINEVENLLKDKKFVP